MTESNKFGISKKSYDKLLDLFVRHPEIESAVIYGSRAIGNYRTGSDIDLAIAGPKLNLNHHIKLQTEIEDLLLPYTVDLAIFSTITNTNLLDHIKRVGIEFYRKT